MQFDVDGRLGQAPNFFFGFATLLQLSKIFPEVQAAEAPFREDASNTALRAQLCAVLTRYQETIALGIQRMELGQSVSPEAAAQIMPGLRQHEGIAGQYSAAYCEN